MEMIPEISACGLCCGECRRFKTGSCKGCAANQKASWCKTRACCLAEGYRSCADCTKADIYTCPKYNNFMTKLFKLIFRSDRHGCIERIREVGYEEFLSQMRVSGSYNRPTPKTDTLNKTK